MPLSTGSRLGPYELLSPLGAGGMGEVYRARDTRLAREVAIKVLPAALSGDASRLKRFETEAKSASALNHPNIVTIYDVGSEGGVSYIAMEKVDGETLRKLLAGGALAAKRLLSIATQIAEGLSRAHEAGIVHRDLKPENLMITKDGLVKILDFGLAKLSYVESGEGESHLPTMTGTSPGMVVGTAGYMSPEQASGERVDFRSDQFSFGSIVYEMATGKRAFLKKTAVDTLSAILNEEPEPIGSMNPQAPVPLRWIVERCLAKDPDGRYASTKDLARELAMVSGHLSEAVSGIAGAAAIAPRRRRLGVLIAAMLFSVALGVLAGRLLWNRTASAPLRFQQVTFQKTNIYTAKQAPDGQTIVYSTRRADGRLELFQTRPGSRGSHSLGILDFKIASISPSGEMALIQENDAGSVLAVAPMGGGEPRPLIQEVSWADWAPDGKSLAIVHGPIQSARLEFPVGNLLHEPAEGRIRVSPRGDRVVFNDAGRRLAVVDRKKAVKVLADTNAGEYAWSPDGKEVWFTRIADGSTHLFAVTLAGRERLLYSLPGDFTFWDVSPQGRVLFEREFEHWQVVGLFPGDVREHPYNWLDATLASELSADGKTLLFNEKEPGWKNAMSYTRKTDGSPAVPLSEGFCRSFSPDGRWAICRTELLAPSLTLASTAGETRNLPNGGLELKMTCATDWLSDGKSIVLTAHAHGRPSRIYVQSVDGSAPVPITPEGVEMNFGAKAVSPDGSFVVGTKDGLAALYPVKGGEAVPLPGLSSGDLPIQWSADGKALYFIREDEPGKIWLVEVVGGPKRLFKEIPPSEPGLERGRGGLFSVHITPDGRSYVATYSGTLADLFVLDGVK